RCNPHFFRPRPSKQPHCAPARVPPEPSFSSPRVGAVTPHSAPPGQWQAFLVKVRTTGPEALNEASLLLPLEMKMTAPAVHVPARNEVVWRVVAEKNGGYNVIIGVAGQTLSKAVVASSGL